MFKVAHAIERVIFASRWLLAPVYLGLVVVLAILTIRFCVELYALALTGTFAEGHTFILDVLALLDIVLLGNLIVIVLFAGYENFVSKIEVAEDAVDRPYWMGAVDFSGLKIKLIGSLVAISVIELLKDFIELGGNLGEKVGDGTVWRVVIHLTFVASGVLFAVMDYISDLRSSKAH